MIQKLYNLFHRRNLQVLSLAAVAMISSFSLGIQSAGDVRPVSLIQAGSMQNSGDMNNDGVVDTRDVIIILEISQGYTTPTVSQVEADPNGDGKITVDDAIRILHRI